MRKLLAKLDACEEAVKWVGGRDLATAWAECERGDWMLWLVGRMCGKAGWPTRQQVVLAACACAARSLRYSTDPQRRPHKAIAVAMRWAKGKATIEEVRTATDAAYAEAAEAATYAAAAAAAEAATYAPCATYAANWSANACEKSLKISAGICRRMLKFEALRENEK